MIFLRSFFTFLLIWSSVVSAEMILPPPINASQEKYFDSLINRYVWLAPYHSAQLSHRGFDPRLHHILAQQHENVYQLDYYHHRSLELIKKIRKVKGASKAMEDRPELLNFQIKVIGAEEVLDYHLAANVKSQLIEMNEKSIQLAIEQRLQQKGRFQGALTAVLKLLPKELASAGFALGVPEKQMNFVEKNWAKVSEQDLQEKFNGEAFDLAKPEITKERILQLMRRLVEQEQAGQMALINLVIKQQLPDESFEDAIKKIRFNSTSDFEEQANQVLEDFILDQENLPTFVEQVQKQSLERAEKRKTKEYVEDILTIHEMAAFPAIFRGTVGGDCATEQSWAYAFSPFERIFLVTHGGEDIAYVAGTMVTVNRRPTFYLRDIAGANITSLQVDYILDAFYKIQKELGVKQIVLANLVNLSRLNGYADIASRIQTAYGSKNPVNIQFDPVDVEIRNTVINPEVGLALAQDYDSPETHKQGILMGKPSDVDYLEIEFNINARVTEAETTKKLTKQKLHDYLLLAIQNRISFTEEVEEKDFENIVRLAEVLKNDEQRNLNQYYKDIEKGLEKFDIQLSQKLLHAWMDIFADGHLRAPDATSRRAKDSWQRNTVDFALDRILRSPSPRWAYQAIGNDPEFFERSEKFQRFVRAQITPEQPDRNRQARLQTLIFDRGVTLSRFLELTDEEAEWLGKTGFEEIQKEHAYKKHKALSLRTDLSIQELHDVAVFLDPDKGPDQKDLSDWAIDILYKHKQANPFILKELALTIRDDDSPRVAVPAALLYLQLSKTHEVTKKSMERALKVLAKWSDNDNVPKEYQREAKKSYGKEIKALRKKTKCEEKLSGSENL